VIRSAAQSCAALKSLDLGLCISEITDRLYLAVSNANGAAEGRVAGPIQNLPTAQNEIKCHERKNSRPRPERNRTKFLTVRVPLL